MCITYDVDVDVDDGSDDPLWWQERVWKDKYTF
jgi:hypothetical protein